MNQHPAPAETLDRWGIGLGYEDALGQWREVTEETRAALHASMRQLGRGPRDGENLPLVIRVGRSMNLESAARVRLEDGTTLPISAKIPADLPTGYHDLLDHHGGVARRLIVAPERCWLPDDFSIWGWSAQLYAARSERSWGIGDLADLRRLAEWSAGQGAGILLVNPLSADTPVSPLRASPYSPSSRCFRNVLYLCVEEVPGAERGDAELERAAAAGRGLNQLDRIDRDEVLKIKRRALDRLWLRFAGNADFELYIHEQGALLQNFCRFSALAEKFGRDWRQWPEEFRHPKSSGVLEFAEEQAGAVRFHAWLQWLLDRQSQRASSPLRVMQDLPIGVDPAGADAWMWQDLIAPGVTVGAPPDKFNPAGQDWGLAAFAPHALRRANYLPLIQTLRAVLRHAGGLRIDHIMGLFRLYWIPPGCDPAAGAYVHYPTDDLLAILALESQRAGAVIVGEDLGTLDEGARKKFAAAGVLSYRLTWFEEVPPEEFPRQALAAVSTHDLPTIAGLWSGQDASDLRKAGVKSDTQGWNTIRDRLQEQTGLPKDAAAEAVIREAYRGLARAPSAIVTAALEDALAAPHRPNMPSTIDAWPNWSQALPGGIEALANSQLARAIAEELNHGKRSGRRAEAPATRRS